MRIMYNVYEFASYSCVERILKFNPKSHFLALNPIYLLRRSPCCLFNSWMVIWTHWGRVTHICISKLNIIGSDNGLSPGRCQAIMWTNTGILLIWPSGTNFSEMLIEIHTFSFMKIHVKMLSAKRRPFCLGLNVLKCHLQNIDHCLKLGHETGINCMIYWKCFYEYKKNVKMGITTTSFLRKQSSQGFLYSKQEAFTAKYRHTTLHEEEQDENILSNL